jgi:hypothetical protein
VAFFLLVVAAYIFGWAYTCYRISQEPRLAQDRRAVLAAAGVLLGPAAFLYWPWLLHRLAEERSSVE